MTGEQDPILSQGIQGCLLFVGVLLGVAAMIFVEDALPKNNETAWVLMMLAFVVSGWVVCNLVYLGFALLFKWLLTLLMRLKRQ